jgi:hypothetical protein
MIRRPRTRLSFVTHDHPALGRCAGYQLDTGNYLYEVYADGSGNGHYYYNGKIVKSLPVSEEIHRHNVGRLMVTFNKHQEACTRYAHTSENDLWLVLHQAVRA